MSGFRLASGGAIDRATTLDFTFEGRPYTGHPGDTLASALLANGVSTVGRSFKYHRRRGIVAAGAEDAGALVQIGTGALTIPNLKPSLVPLYQGLVANPVNCWPSLAFDLRAAHQWLKPFLPAGFYNKTFTWPDWRWFEPAIRRAAGFGVAPQDPDPDRYAKRYLTTDVLVVGAGPAGLAAAITAASAGTDVVLVEQADTPGGSARVDTPTIAGEAASTWVAATWQALGQHATVRCLTNTMAFGVYDHGLVGAIERLAPPGAAPGVRERLWQIRAGAIILATGAIERPIVFADNDRPGVMLAHSVRRYLALYGVAPARRWVIATTGDEGHRAAQDLVRAGQSVVALADSRHDPTGAWVAASRAAGIDVRAGSVVAQAIGGTRVEGAVLRDRTGRESRHPCDGIAVHGGWSPALHLHAQATGSLRWDDARHAFVPDRLAPGVLPVVAWSTAEAVAEGQRAGLLAAAAAGCPSRSAPAPEVVELPDQPSHPVWEVPPPWSAGPRFVDLLADVTADDVALAARENYTSVEHLKRFTTTGMAPDQGKTSNVTAIALMAAVTGRSIPGVGTTRFRPPYDPVSLGALVGSRRGALFAPTVRLPLDAEHKAAGAVFDEYSRWQRPAWYGVDRAEALHREVLAVRRGVGLFDASSLGKILVSGPDAGRLLDFVYVQSVSTLGVGRIRYGLMLTEHGIILDDGVVARLGETEFLVSPSSAMAPTIAGLLDELLQCDFPEFQAFSTNLTHAAAVLTLTGPQAKTVLASVGTDVALNAFGHMEVRVGRVGDLRARVARVSFTGEASYEIAVAADDAPLLWQRLFEAGRPFGLVPIGMEALMVLRLEKGYLIHGIDTDGETTPDDVGMAGGIAKKVSDFIGRRSLFRPEQRRSGRRQLVGLVPVDERTLLPAGGHVRLTGSHEPTDGWVTSSARSPTLGRPIALGLVADGRRRIGETCIVADGVLRIPARLVTPTHYDPAGERLHG